MTKVLQALLFLPPQSQLLVQGSLKLNPMSMELGLTGQWILQCKQPIWLFQNLFYQTTICLLRVLRQFQLAFCKMGSQHLESLLTLISRPDAVESTSNLQVVEPLTALA